MSLKSNHVTFLVKVWSEFAMEIKCHRVPQSQKVVWCLDRVTISYRTNDDIAQNRILAVATYYRLSPKCIRS